MNIYVFYVNRGDMLTFDVALSVESVARLQEAIKIETDIPVESQVLLISGGETMSPSSRVCNYSGGTDTCPIFLFSLRAIEEKTPPDVSTDIDQTDIRHRIEGSLNMGPTLTTLSTRTQLALELRDLSHKHKTLCQTLVHHQHLQHQGWSTVIANLEDTRQAFVELADKFTEWYQGFLANKSAHVDMLTCFPESVEMLGKMPILTPLTEILSKSVYQGLLGDGNLPKTLMQLLDTLENDHDLLSEADVCLQDIQQLDEELLFRLLDEKDKILEQADKTDMKEVRGLEDRLFGLEQLIANAGKLVKDQEDYAQGFVHNQNRFRQLSDPQILADLCRNHKEQLRAMEAHDNQLRQIATKCLEAKKELSNNLHQRLRWTMFVERKISSVDSKIALNYENCRRLKLQIDKLHQIHKAPVVYAKLCAEVCRRRKFAEKYTRCGQTTYTKFNEWHQKEVDHRREFYKSIGLHFLKSFFPGLEKLPPALMTAAITQFDDELPLISEEDIICLRQKLPELESYLRVSDCDAVASECATPLSSRVQSHDSSSIAVISPRIEDSANSISIGDEVTAASSTIVSGSVKVQQKRLVQSDGANVSHNKNEAQSTLHLMSPCEPVSQDDEYLSLYDEQPSAAMADEDSGGFMTANFFLSDELESVSARNVQSPVNMADTITMQNSEIEKLYLDNAALKQKCDLLYSIIHRFKTMISKDIQTLQSTHTDVREELRSYENQFTSSQAQILTALDSCPKLQQQELNKQVSTLEQQYKTKLNVQSQQAESLESQNTVLVEKLDQMKVKYEELQAQMEKTRLEQQKQLELVTEQTKDSITKQLTLEHELELENATQNYKASLETKNCEIAAKDAEVSHLVSELEQVTEDLKNSKHQHGQSVESLKQEYSNELSAQMANLKATHEHEVQSFTAEMEARLKAAQDEADQQKLAALSTLEISLNAKYEKNLKAMVKTTTDSCTNTEFDHDKHIKEITTKLEQERKSAMAQLEAELENKYKTQLEEQRQRHEKEFEHRAATMKESLQTVSDVKFNEKLNQVKKEKDSVIAELQKQLRAMRSARNSTSSLSAMTDSAMSASVVTVDRSSLKATEEKLIERDEVIRALQSKISSFEMTASSREVIKSDKVTVRSIAAGDKVILCFDERHNNYVVFTISNTLHFLHTDCLKDLGLDRDPESKRLSWVLAEIVDKEYCQAKKATNRFNVPVGTRFYRVKAKPCQLS